MFLKRSLHLALSLLLTVNLAVPLAARTRAVEAQSASASNPSTDLAARLSAIESFVESKRRELGIPGLALVIVKNDQIILMKGFGLRDVEHNLPVTPDTVFAIGSATKAFTALAAMMSVDDGKISLDDSPKKFLPYFRMRDPEADAKITMRDLLAHRSGLARTDLAMVTNQLSREELIRVAGMAKPTAKLGERFQYQNIMYVAAGEALARAQNTTWERFVTERIFKPLGMNSTGVTVDETERAADHSLGYESSMETHVTWRVPMRRIPSSAPAGAINSSARDMARWLRFLLAGGVIDGRRLISERSFNEMWTKQIGGALGEDYGLGWFLGQWRGHKVVHHGGNIDGFNAEVAMMPDEKLGFAVLTNVTASSLPTALTESVWNNLVGDGPATGATVDPQTEVGSYRLVQAGINIEIAFRNGRLEMTVPNQPVYPLENIGGRKYRLMEPAPPGFYATFRTAQNGETEMFLEQPNVSFVLPKVKASSATEAQQQSAHQFSALLREAIGSYEFEQEPDALLEIREQGSEVVAIAPMQPPYPLRESAPDQLAFKNLPASYSITIKRDEHGKIVGLVIKQPEGEFRFRRAADASGATISVEELMSKTVAALGGEANLRKHNSFLLTFDIDYENQGVIGEGRTSARAPGAYATDVTLMALGKKIGRTFEYFDGTSGGAQATFFPPRTYAGRQLAMAHATADFYGALDWKKLFKSVLIKRIAKVNDEDAYVVVKTTQADTTVTDYYSTKTFLLLRREASTFVNDIEVPIRSDFSDYRNVDGVMVAFKSIVNSAAMGDITIRVREVKFNVPLPDSTFHAQPGM